jgi:transcription elongation factor GreB
VKEFFKESMTKHHSEKNYITPKGLKRLQDELSHLLKTERPEITKTIAWAASNGDRSENADYIYGKKRLREIDKRIRFLTQRIEAAVVVDPTSVIADRVQFGATVEIEDEEGESRIISVVGIDEINTDKGFLSWRSPIGSALIGKMVGDTIEVQTPKGLSSFEIIEIIYQEIDL